MMKLLDSLASQQSLSRTRSNWILMIFLRRSSFSVSDHAGISFQFTPKVLDLGPIKQQPDRLQFQ